MKAKWNRKDVVQRLTALGVRPTQQRYVLLKLGLALPAYGDGGAVDEESPALDSPDSYVPGNLYATPQPVLAESLLARASHVPEYFLHYLANTDAEPRRIPISNIDTSKPRLSKFDAANRILAAGKPGSCRIAEKLSYQTDKPESYYLGHVEHHLVGLLHIDRSGRYSFNGTLTAGPDLYNMDPDKDRTETAEKATTFGRSVGRAVGDIPFPVYIAGSKPFAESGRLPLPPEPPDYL
jgi:hypothetical protein